MFDGLQNLQKYPTPAPPIPPADAVKPWGCHSKPRKDGYWARSVFRGHLGTLPPVEGWVWIEDTGSKECQYRKSAPADPRCLGCTSP